jgi:hypothetical protein
MRGRGRTLASALADALAARPEAQASAVSLAFSEACGPRLAREASARGILKDGRLLVLARTAEWAAQITALEHPLRERINARLGRAAVTGLEVRIAPERR